MKRKLLLAMLCVAGALGFKANAQSWTGNAPAEGTTFYLYNVGQQKFLTSGNWWGTHAALDTDGMPVTLTLSDGAYKIYDTAVSFGTSKGLGSDEYVDNGSPVAWTFTQIGSTGKYTLKNGSNYFVSNGNGVPVNTTTEPTTDDGYWQLVTRDDLIANLNNATPENPIDASFYMTNPRVRRNWPKSISGTGLSDNGSFNAGVAGLYAGGCTSYGQYHKTFDNYQALTGVKNGKYKVTVKGFNRLDGGDNNSAAYLYANSQKITLKTKGDIGGDDKENATKALVDDTYLSDPVTVTVTDGNLRVGVKSDANCGWTTFAQFTLMFVEPFISYLATESFTSGSTMEANQWYTFTVPTDGDYTLSATDGIVYAAEDKLGSEAGAATSTVALKAGTAYFKSTTEQTLTITYVEPVVENGDYYLYDATNKVFLSRGANFGARATVDKYGIPFTWNNYSKTIVFKDWTSKELFFDKANHSNCWLYTDGSNKGVDGQFSFETADAEGGLYLRDNAKTVYINHDGSVLNVPTTSSTNATVWTIMTKAEHDAIVNAYPTDNKTNVIAAASLTSETDAAGFESWLAANRAAKDKTSSVGTAKFTGEAGDWTWTRNTNGAKDATYGTDWTEAFQTAVGTWSQTITGLQEGVYKVTVNAFERAADYATCNTLGEAGWEPVTAYFMANDQQIQLKSWYSDKEETNNPNTTDEAATAFNNDKYKNQLYTYVGDDGNLTITIGKPGKADGSWVLFNNVTLTYYDTAVDEGDATAIIDEATTTMESPMKHSLYAALSTAKETFDGARTVPNYNALRAAIDNTATSIASYANMNTNYLTPLNTYFATTNFVQSDAYNTYLGYKNSYDNYKTTGADVENAKANALSITQGSGTNYTSTYSLMMLPNWTIGTTPASTTNSGFYMNTWSTESAGEGDAKDFANPFYEYWVSSGSLAANTITGTLTGLTPNKAYDVTAKVRVQGDSKVAGSITMEVVGGVPVDVTAGDKIGETSRYIKSYTATGVTDADGNLELKFNIAANSNVSWLSFRDVNYVESAATISNDFTAIDGAISTAEAYTLGFESGEYAPYNNVDALTKLEAAKNFDKTRYYIPSVISSTATALSEATWTENVGEKNAIYWADYTSGDIAGDGFIHPLGWTNTGYNTRIYSEAAGNKDTNTGISAVNNLAMMSKYNTTYGETTGYTMPLKAATIYKITFKYCGWGNTPTTNIVLTDPESNTITLAPGFIPATNNGNTNAENWYSYTGYFVSTTAGNYVLAMNKVESGQQQIGIGDIELVSASEIVFADGSVPTYAPGTYPTVKITRTLTAGRWATGVYPFAVSGVDNIAVLDSYDKATGALGFTSAAASTANEPFFMMSTTDKSEITLSDVAVAAANATPATASKASLIGAYTATDITGTEKNYVLSNNKIFSVGDKGATINPYRAYIQIDESTPVKALSFIVDGTATGVEAPEVTEAEEEEILYNTAGVRVGKDYKGIVINQKGEKRLQK